ncbi:hypothetical protein ACLKA6_015855 [Drosophila palustris]
MLQSLQWNPSESNESPAEDLCHRAALALLHFFYKTFPLTLRNFTTTWRLLPETGGQRTKDEGRNDAKVMISSSLKCSFSSGLLFLFTSQRFQRALRQVDKVKQKT